MASTETRVQRDKREREKALRQASTHRHGLRGRIVVQVNVARLRQLRERGVV